MNKLVYVTSESYFENSVFENQYDLHLVKGFLLTLDGFPHHMTGVGNHPGHIADEVIGQRPGNKNSYSQLKLFFN